MAEMMMPGDGQGGMPGGAPPGAPGLPPPTAGGVADQRLMELAQMAMQPGKPRDMEGEQAALLYYQTMPALLEMARLNPRLGPLLEAFSMAATPKVNAPIIETSMGLSGLMPQTSQITPMF